MQKEITIDCRGCGVQLSTKLDAKPKWYGTYKGCKPISGACEDCFQTEKKEGRAIIITNKA